MGTEPTVTRRVITESGTIYEFDDELKLVRRVLAGGAEDLRRDGDWLQLFITNVAILGYSMCLYLEPLNSDTGKHPFTFRRTSPVVSVELVDHVEATLEAGEIVYSAAYIRKRFAL